LSWFQPDISNHIFLWGEKKDNFMLAARSI